MDNLSLNTLFEKVGGRYSLSVLTQKRVTSLMKGAAPLGENCSKDPYLMALAEIDQDKITLSLPEKRKEPVAK